MDPLQQLADIRAQLQELAAQAAARGQSLPTPDLFDKLKKAGKDLEEAHAKVAAALQAQSGMTETAGAVKKIEPSARVKRAAEIKELKAKHGPNWVFAKKMEREAAPPPPPIDHPTVDKLVRTMLVGMKVAKPHKDFEDGGDVATSWLWEDE